MPRGSLSASDAASALTSPPPSDFTGTISELLGSAAHSEVAGVANDLLGPQSTGSMFDDLFADVFASDGPQNPRNGYEGSVLPELEPMPFTVPSGQPLPSYNPFTGVASFVSPPEFPKAASESDRELEHYGIYASSAQLSTFTHILLPEFLFYSEFLDQAPIFHVRNAA
jgi:hypothetical protein